MNIREIAEALRINRNSVAKYLEILGSREEVDIKVYGKSKVYFLSQRVPISRLLDYSSQYMIILNRDLQIVQINKTFLLYLNRTKESVIGRSVHDLSCDLINNRTVLDSFPLVMDGQELNRELSVSREKNTSHYRLVLTPTQFPDHTRGIILLFEDITDKKQVEIALKENEEKFRSFVEESGDGCAIVDDRGIIIDWNRAQETITSIRRDQAIGRPLTAIIETLIPEDRKSEERITHCWNLISKMLADEPLSCFNRPVEIHIARGDGKHRIIQHTVFPVQLAKKKHFGVIMRDITDHKVMEESLQRETALLTALLDSIPDIIFFKDTVGTYLGCNSEFARHVGRSREEITGRMDYDLYPAESAESFREHDRIVLESGRPRHNEEWIEYPDGRHVLVDTFKSPLVGIDGQIMGILGVSRDITDRKETENLIRESEEKYRRIVETANEGIWVIDNQSSTTFVNRKMADMLGFAVQEMIGRKILHAMHPDHHADHAARMQNQMAGKSEIYERCFIRKDGSTCWMLLSATPIPDPGGGFGGSFAMLTDITERKRSEEILRESEERFRILLESVPSVAVQGYLPDGSVVYWNKANTALYGYTADEAIGHDIRDLIIPPEVRGQVTAAIARMAATGTPEPAAEVNLMRRDGSLVPVFSSHAIVKILGKNPMLFCIDINMTPVRRAEEALRKSEERFRQVVASSGVWIWEVDQKGMYTYCSSAVENILGYRPEELVGKKHFYDLFEPEVKNHLEKEAMAAFARQGSFWHFINPNVHKNGTTVILESSGIPVIDERGIYTGYRGTDRDITRRIKMEIVQGQALKQIEKNIEQFACLGDQIRNPLQGIVGLVTFSSGDIADKMKMHVDAIDRIVDQIDKGWIESEKVRSILKKYYNFGTDANEPRDEGTITGLPYHKIQDCDKPGT